MEGLITFVLAGGRGKRLRPLTRRRPKALIPFAGRRLLDFTLENCARSALGRVTVLAQHLAPAVDAHVRKHWPEEAEVVAPHVAGRRFRGTADAVRAALRLRDDGDRVLVLPCDQIYATDYRWLMATHLMADAEMTLPVTRIDRDEARGLCVLEAGPTGLVRSFVERPERPPAAPLASLGIFLFERHALEAALSEHTDALDFGQDLLPRLVAGGRRIAVRTFVGRWRDIADVDAYFDAHAPYGQHGNGCYVWPGARFHPGARIEDSILLDGAEVGEGACLRRTIVDEGVRVPAGARIGFDPAEDAAFGHVTPGGVTVVTAASSAAPVCP